MAELLLELFSEEIPAGLQGWAADELGKRIHQGLTTNGLETGKRQTFSTPRRLGIVIEDVPEKTPDIKEERKGPRVGAPQKAIDGFVRAAGLASIEQAEKHSDKKGEFYVAVLEKKGVHTSTLISQIVCETIKTFPWPKSMRWGAGQLRWVRPLHSILCLLDDDSLGEAVMDGLRDIFGTDDEKRAKDDIVHLEIQGINSDNTTYGHRFMAPGLIWVENFASYKAKLAQAKVMLAASEREAVILKEARSLAESEGLELVEDMALLRETAGLVEWPVVLMGSFDEDFLAVPPEVLTISMKKHQKCFSLKQPGTDKLANKFILVSNLVAQDGGAAIRAGNEKVINARLSDARFFWDQDRKLPLERLLPKLDNIIFHAKLGTQGQRVKRLEQLAKDIAPFVDADPAEAKEAAMLAKADLVTEMVGEFPDLQGLMGKYYAAAGCRKPQICAALHEHYLPQGPADPVPDNPVSIAVSLADKLDTLTGFWSINEKPTGSKDPYALRRAALGVIRIILENKLRLDLFAITRLARHYYGDLLPALTRKNAAAPLPAQERKAASKNKKSPKGGVLDINQIVAQALERSRTETAQKEDVKTSAPTQDSKTDDYDDVYLSLLSFFIDRLKVYLRDKGLKHDRIDAVLATGVEDDLLLIVKRVEALDRFLATDDGANLLAGVKRATNILRIEEKKDKTRYIYGVRRHDLVQKEEQALAQALETQGKQAQEALQREDFEDAMRALARLRKPVDDFFDHVTVNADDKTLRLNRLNLLGEIRETIMKIADLSRIEG